jgi:hypothetical protein
MGMNPINTTNSVRDEYIKYLKSMFFFKDEGLRDAADKAIEKYKKELVKGPFLESTASYKSGATLREIIKDNRLHKGFDTLVSKIGEFPLHIHQEKAIDKAVVEKKNMIVATGTGSGKTECFLIPILNYLIEQKHNNELTPGIRALVLYPMNALANDQLKRLRKLLGEHPEITFGRYTGESKEKREEALDYFKKTNPEEMVYKNELLSREEMRGNPPHILLTNYAMLEYLLLRPEDNVFFDGIYKKCWKYLILDEAHVYSGALGSELSYLISRLKDRIVDGEKGRIQCIATSATLGGEKEDIKEIINYAQDLFGEDFEQDSLITSERKITLGNTGLIKPNIDWYRDLFNLIEEYEGESLVDEINKRKIYDPIEKKKDTNEIIYDSLKQDHYVNILKQIIEKKTMLIQDVIKQLFGEYTESTKDAFLAMVDIAAKAKKEDNSEVLLPARYHVFSKSIEGAFLKLYPNKELYLNRKESELEGTQTIKVFELANCVKCGQEYIIGKVNNGYLKQTSGMNNIENQRAEFFLLKNSFNGIELDEDSIVDDHSEELEEKIYNAEELLLCIVCGRVHKANKKSVDCCSSSKVIRIYKVISNGIGRLNTCLGCGSYSIGIVKRLINADAPTTEMLGRTLYQNIPPEKSNENSKKNENTNSTENTGLFSGISIFGDIEKKVHSEINGRKLLAFSDSRKKPHILLVIWI